MRFVCAADKGAKDTFFVGAWMVGVECEVLACVCWLTEDFEVGGSVRLSADECVHER